MNKKDIIDLVLSGVMYTAFIAITYIALWIFA